MDWDAHTHDTLILGRRMRFVDLGEGPAILLIHGLGGSWQNWLENISALAEGGFRVLAVDLPGFGHSDALPPPAPIAQHARCLAALLDHHEIERGLVVGHSLGALVAMHFAEALPERTSGLVLVDGGALAISARRLALIVRVSAVFDLVLGVPGVMPLVVRNAAVRRLVLGGLLRNPGTLSGELAEQIMPAVRAPGVRTAVGAAAYALRDIEPARITPRTLVVWGDCDPIVPFAEGERLAREIPNARLLRLEGVGHFPMFEAPALLNAALVAFAEEGHAAGRAVASTGG